MKFISYNKSTEKLYVAGPVIVAGVVVILVLAGLLTFWAIFFYAFVNTQYSFDQRKLGELPAGFEKNEANSDEETEKLAQEIRKKYDNKLNILFFLDGFSDSKKGVGYVDMLTKSLEQDPQFKDVLPGITTVIFTSEGEKCWVSQNHLVCDARTYDGFKGLGIERFKVVLISPKDFLPEAAQAHGENTFISLSASSGKDLKRDFITSLRKSISLDVLAQGKQEEYLRGVVYCFYGNKESYIYPEGTFRSCVDFKKQYPKFWKE